MLLSELQQVVFIVQKVLCLRHPRADPPPCLPPDTLCLLLALSQLLFLRAAGLKGFMSFGEIQLYYNTDY